MLKLERLHYILCTTSIINAAWLRAALRIRFAMFVMKSAVLGTNQRCCVCVCNTQSVSALPSGRIPKPAEPPKNPYGHYRVVWGVWVCVEGWWGSRKIALRALYIETR